MQQFVTTYKSPIGLLTIACDSTGIVGLWIVGQKHFGSTLSSTAQQRSDHPCLTAACRWLDVYFSGQCPDFMPPLHLVGTDFRRKVWEQLLSIPFGATTTYGQLARAIGEPRAAQAVGSAVGRNPISIIVPCHRVLGANGSLTGYAGGINNKQFLLNLES